MKHDWRALMQAAQAGDKGAYNTLLTSLSGWLRAYFSALARPGDVDDLVQETLIAIHTKRHTYDPRYPFMPWLKTIARHKWIDRMRSIVRQAEVEMPEEQEAVMAAVDAVTATQDVRKLLATLPEKQANVIRLVRIDGLSMEEAAVKSGQSVAAVKVNIHRGLKRLMAAVQEKNDEPESDQ
jgi:RNA polymerase sigma-70 factor (ECF subfamily)